MKLLARVIASAAIAAAALWGAYRLCYERHLCNLQEARAQETLTRMLSLPDQATTRIVARRTMEEMTRCIEMSPTSISAYMIRAAALRMLGRDLEAAMDYRRALRLDRRAELYFNLGLTELDAGREEHAADALTTAVFILYSYAYDIPQPMQERVKAVVNPTYQLIQRHQAPPAVLEELRQRVTRDPM